ncbi:MAG TPA: hypothetical protein VFZ61_04825 [Polyangiales bacterium]
MATARRLLIWVCLAPLAACRAASVDYDRDASPATGADLGDTGEPATTDDGAERDSAAEPGEVEAGGADGDGAVPEQALDGSVDAEPALPLDAMSQPAHDATPPTTIPDATIAVPTPGCLAGITDYKQRGPFGFRSEQDGKIKLFVPSSVPADCKLPIVHVGNGTGASCSNYMAVIEHLASHGFLVTCYESASFVESHCLQAVDAAYRLHPELAGNALGFTGHHTGAAGAYVCVQRAEETWGSSRLYAGHAAQPASGTGDSPNWQATYAKIRSPMFQFHGSEDVLVSAGWVKQSYDALADSTEAYWFEARGATLIPVAARYMQESSVVFFRWKLLGDMAACRYFQDMQRSADWSLAGQQNAATCESTQP